MKDITSNENQNLYEEFEKHKIEDDSSITGGTAPISGPQANSVAVNIENNYIGDDGIVFDAVASFTGGFSPAYGGPAGIIFDSNSGCVHSNDICTNSPCADSKCSVSNTSCHKVH